MTYLFVGYENLEKRLSIRLRLNYKHKQTINQHNMFIICLFMTYFQTISEHSYCGVVLIRYSSEIVVKICRGSRLHKFAKK